jgi:NTE family protein
VTRLKDTLSDLIEFDLFRTGSTRLTVGAANVETSEMTYFDSRAMALDIRHVLASGALPPAFPAVEIDGHHYWDGGILTNTPVEVVFDDNPRRNSIVYAVHVWNPEGAAPQTMSEVENRRKDVQYSSRSAAHIARQRQLHRLRHVITPVGGPATRREPRGSQDSRPRKLWLSYADACSPPARAPAWARGP